MLQVIKCLHSLLNFIERLEDCDHELMTDGLPPRSSKIKSSQFIENHLHIGLHRSQSECTLCSLIMIYTVHKSATDCSLKVANGVKKRPNQSWRKLDKA